MNECPAWLALRIRRSRTCSSLPRPAYMPATKPTSVARYESMLPARAAPPTVPPVVDSRCSRILAYGDSLTAGYYDRGAAFWPYANSLRSALCACAVATSSGGADSSVRAERSAVTIDV